MVSFSDMIQYTIMIAAVAMLAIELTKRKQPSLTREARTTTS